uniref:Uncharacterized protein n=1 Tax=Chromera velia CCMP2878 TaxID=1169474 RepID=A0A0G4FHQ9_9ALVE|eukprot:Cvel_17056.t1-p1 / transcript=Cvel_17056.t1 / gene=Cvel_17056 / organism=Chromera_velia_CCMP2878 / gene_product=hypothetical protein / transcript_product=hypothetical protein / location=Cvel_scaffold1343:44751-47336(-) / protein_length=397 / sequence_SO=supercontig / SO=protein_coding / is_pseudo=false
MNRAKLIAAFVFFALVSLSSGSLLFRKVSREEIGEAFSDSVSTILSVRPVSFLYPANAQTLGIPCNTEEPPPDEATTNTSMVETESWAKELKKCVFHGLWGFIWKKREITDLLYSCFQIVHTATNKVDVDVCPYLQWAMKKFLCTKNINYCKARKAGVGLEPPEVPLLSDAPELELLFETPELPLSAQIKGFLSDAEEKTATLLWMASWRMYQMSKNFKCAEGRKKSFLDREVLPGWKPKSIFTPQYMGANEEGLPWISISSRGRSLLVAVRGTATFADAKHVAIMGYPTKVFGTVFAAGRVGDEEWQKAASETTNLRVVQFVVDPIPSMAAKQTERHSRISGSGSLSNEPSPWDLCTKNKCFGEEDRMPVPDDDNTTSADFGSYLITQMLHGEPMM